ncbi:MAG: hypothetical protein KAJ14_10465 [Candidatus Omnitrophica bacterium]|nr:hypothetical protein [Candidatus Omnitrophota bacterium]
MKKGVVLIIVIGIAMIISCLAITVLLYISQGSIISENKIMRTRAYYAAQAGIVSGMEQLRKGDAVNDIVIGSGIDGYAGGLNVAVTYIDDNTGPLGTDPLEVVVTF